MTHLLPWITQAALCSRKISVSIKLNVSCNNLVSYFKKHLSKSLGYRGVYLPSVILFFIILYLFIKINLWVQIIVFVPKPYPYNILYLYLRIIIRNLIFPNHYIIFYRFIVKSASYISCFGYSHLLHPLFYNILFSSILKFKSSYLFDFIQY